MTAPALARTLPDGSREYVHPLTGEHVPSVTTIIKVLDKPFLVPWAAKMAAEHAAANWLRLSALPIAARITEIKNAHIVYTEKAAATGDIVHELIECWSTGVAFPIVPPDISGFVNSFINFLDDCRPKFIENECTLWSRKHGYAGTADFIATIKGKTILGDVKSGKRLYPEVGLQTAALAAADFILRHDGTEEPLPPVDELAALHVRPRTWKLQQIHEQEECFAAFLAAIRLHHWQHQTAPNVLLGNPYVTPVAILNMGA